MQEAILFEIWYDGEILGESLGTNEHSAIQNWLSQGNPWLDGLEAYPA